MPPTDRCRALGSSALERREAMPSALRRIAPGPRGYALLGELFDEGGVHAGGHVPIDGADLVAVLVLAELVEVDALALEDGVVLAADGFADEAAGLELDAADLAEDGGDVFLAFSEGFFGFSVGRFSVQDGGNVAGCELRCKWFGEVGVIAQK